MTLQNTDVIRVVTLQNTDPYAKAGLMIRENLNQDSKNAFIAITSQNGALFSSRTNTGDVSSSSAGSGVTPYWVKLVRIGNLFTGFRSADGINWNQVGSINMPMSVNAFLGMAVTSHNNTKTNNATFDNLNLNFQLPPPPINFLATSNESQIKLSWTAVAGATSYSLKRATSIGGPYSVIAIIPAGTNYTDTAITNGVTYYYVVTSANWNGESANSSQLAAAAPLPLLTPAYSGGSLTLSWPQTVSDFKLYGATNLAPPVGWFLTTNMVTLSNNISSVIIQPGNQIMFFRLAAP